MCIANRIKSKDVILANQYIGKIRKNTFASNADNKSLKYENFDKNASPMYNYHFVNNRIDFSLGLPFDHLLKYKGDINTFQGITDPYLFKYSSLKILKIKSEVKNKDYKQGATAEDYEIYIYGVSNPSTSIDGMEMLLFKLWRA